MQRPTSFKKIIITNKEFKDFLTKLSFSIRKSNAGSHQTWKRENDNKRITFVDNSKYKNKSQIIQNAMRDLFIQFSQEKTEKDFCWLLVNLLKKEKQIDCNFINIKES